MLFLVSESFSLQTNPLLETGTSSAPTEVIFPVHPRPSPIECRVIPSKMVKKRPELEASQGLPNVENELGGEEDDVKRSQKVVLNHKTVQRQPQSTAL